ncbi:aminotransferase class III-fold pyridoxal phosphate-dependent enzyme [Mameliella alba]|nr:aminotransferase class III-fold pyridoxal phosphate-dependent enzyme [Mameliella alba]MBY6171561.1 aminotransferase class III-fold pyridoxal phosphate-dependent enzyme [Mameliella alba]MBY6176786.1 aminotransferase class III-fold pyridoxal phosphate-dependent enzyme [Mameliella alba]
MAQLYPFTDPITAQQEPPRRIVSGDGIRVTDSEGAVFIDAVAALWCASLGFSPDRLKEVMERQMGQLAYYHSFMGRTPQITETLAARLAARLPATLSHVFFGTSGSEAVESAAKIARFYQSARGKPGKSRFIAREGAYHGSGQVSAALTGLGYCHDGFGLPLGDVLRTGRPHFIHDAEPGESEIAFSKRRARELDALIRDADPGTIAAFIGEPAMGAGGVILPPQGYWDEIQNVLVRHDILLIADEIITGFGRTGEWFGCETWGIRPDLMTMAKQLTASVFPMSAVAMTDEVQCRVAEQAHGFGTFGHGVTYGGHPVGAAVALECLDIYEEMDLPRHVQRLGAQVANRLQGIAQLPGVRDTRCKGLLAAVEFEPGAGLGDSPGKTVGAEAERRGVFFRVIGDVLAIAPPYITTAEEMDQIMDVMRDAILSVAESRMTADVAV